MIEVEVKFCPVSDTRERLTAKGAKRVNSSRFTDIYFDTPAPSLMPRSYWLRKRNGRWELKHPIVRPQSGRPASVDRHRELEGEKEVLDTLREGVGLWKKREGEGCLSVMVEEGVLVPVAEFTTSRESYCWEEVGGEQGGVKVDLDMADFGYGVGEVEVMVGSEEEVPGAERRVKAIAAQLGTLTDTPPGGKLSSYLEQRNPSLLQHLLECGVIRRPIACQTAT